MPVKDDQREHRSEITEYFENLFTKQERCLKDMQDFCENPKKRWGVAEEDY